MTTSVHFRSFPFASHIALTFALALGSSPAWAQSAQAQTDVAAILRQANGAHDATDYATALTLYQQAYTINNDPFVLFNIGRMNLLLRRYEPAQRALQRFIERVPNAPNRSVVDTLLREAAQGIAQQQQQEAQRVADEDARRRREEQLRSTQPRPPSDERPTPSRPAWPWALVAVAGGAAIGAGISAGFYASAAGELHDTARSGCVTTITPIECPESSRGIYARAESAGGALLGLSIGAVALGAASAVAFVLTTPRVETRTALNVTVDPRGGSVVVRGSF